MLRVYYRQRTEWAWLETSNQALVVMPMIMMIPYYPSLKKANKPLYSCACCPPNQTRCIDSRTVAIDIKQKKKKVDRC